MFRLTKDNVGEGNTLRDHWVISFQSVLSGTPVFPALGTPGSRGVGSTPHCLLNAHSSPDCRVSLSHDGSIGASGSPASPTQTETEATGVFIQVAHLRSRGNRCPRGERGAPKVTETAGPELKPPLFPPTPTLRPEATPALTGTSSPSLLLLLGKGACGKWQSQSNSPEQARRVATFLPAQLVQTTALPPWPKSEDTTQAAGGLLPNDLQ